MRLSERSVHAGVRNSFGRGVSFVAVVLFLTLLASVALAPIGERAAAASVRIASIVSVSGTVEVKKAGGKKYFKAYKDMPLNAGDHLKTGDKSSVTIRVQDRSEQKTAQPESTRWGLGLPHLTAPQLWQGGDPPHPPRPGRPSLAGSGSSTV